MLSIFFKEIKQFFSSLTGYIAIILFLLVNGIFLFLLEDNIFDFGYATLDRFFTLAPWVFIFLIPALTMRIMADEFKAGTFEILQTKPLTKWQIALGKYFAVLVVLLLVIIPTFIYVITIKKLSAQNGIDSGGITGSYIGLFFLAAVFASIGICSSSYTNNAVIAFLISTFACIIMYFGFGAISKLPFLSNNAGYYVEMLGIDFHYKSMSRGVLDSRDVVYFISIIFLFLLITVKNFRNK